MARYLDDCAKLVLQSSTPCSAYSCWLRDHTMEGIEPTPGPVSILYKLGMTRRLCNRHTCSPDCSSLRVL
eukprot:1168050-Amphidinium_carterae.1